MKSSLFTSALSGLFGGLFLAGGAVGGGFVPPPANAAPVWTSASSITAAENGAGTIYTCTATDAEGDARTFAIAGGADAALFVLAGAALRFAAPPNFEAPGSAAGTNLYDVVLSVADGNNPPVPQPLAVTVTNVLEQALSGVTVTPVSGLVGDQAAGAVLATIAGRIAVDDLALTGALAAAGAVFNGAKTQILAGAGGLAVGDFAYTVTQSHPDAAGTAVTNGTIAVAAAGATVPLTSIDADGWQATYAGAPPSTLLNTSITATGISGFSDVGAAIATRTLSTGLRITKRLRNPGLTTLQAAKVGLSLIVPQGATLAGVANNSTKVPPPPIANWQTRFDQVLSGGADKTVEVVVGHYYAGLVPGEQVACVEFILSDGVNPSITRRTAFQVQSTTPGDLKPVFVYRVTFTAADYASLNNGQLTYQCNVYPFIGTGASVARTSDFATRGLAVWKFAPRYDIKDPVRAGAVPRCYLDAAGVDASGVWSTNDATAAAAPFLTLAGALAAGKISAIPAGSVIPAGNIDGCEVRARAGTFAVTGSGVTVAAKGAALILTRDPATPKANAIWTQSATAPRMRFGSGGTLYAGMTAALVVSDCSFTRSGAGLALGDAQRTKFIFVDLLMNMGAISSAMGNSSCDYQFANCTITNVAGNSVSALCPTAGGGWQMRGCDVSANGADIPGYNLTGNRLRLPGAFGTGTMNADNGIIGFNVVTGDVGTSYVFSQVSGLLVIGNSNEWVTTTTNPTWRVSGDGSTGSTFHVLEMNNTYGGANDCGRHNDRYVDTDATGARTHDWCRSANNIKVQANTKHDLFPPANAARVGGWQVLLGVGYQSNFIQFRDAGGGSFGHEYADPTSTVGASNSVGLNPRFKDPKHTTYDGATYTAGAGNGDQRLMRISEGDPFDSPCLTGAEMQFLPGFGAAIGAYA